MKKFFISIILLFSATAVYSQVENDRTITSSYQDKNIIYSLSVKIRPYKLTDTVEAKLYIKNIGNIPLYIEKTKNDSVITFTDENYFEEIFRYGMLGRSVYYTEYSYELYLTELKPGEEKSARLIVPLILAKGLKGQTSCDRAIHTREFRVRVGLQLDCGYLPKESSSFPIISKDGRFDNHSELNQQWLEWKVKQFTLGPIYVGLEIE